MASAIVYLLVSAAVMGLVPHHALVGNGTPFVNAFEPHDLPTRDSAAARPHPSPAPGARA